MTEVNDCSPPALYRRVATFEIVPVPDGYVVYDDTRGMVHYLNPTAAMVLELCDVCQTEAAVAQRIQTMFDLGAPPEAEVDSCLLQLVVQGLILRN